MLQNWTNPGNDYAFSGISKIYNHYKGAKTLKEIENEMSEIRTYTLHKEKKPIRNYNPFFVYYKHQMWQSDLIYLPNFIHDNDQYKYLICVIDVFSRKLYVKLLKTKDAKVVLEAFTSIHSSIQHSPEILYVDMGGEYINKNFKKYCADNGIKLVFTFNDTKAAHVERAQRSLQSILYKMMEERQTRRYIDLLDEAVSIYNNRVNRITGFSPNEAFKDENSDKVLENLSKFYNKSVNLRKPPKFKIGDLVRISLKRRVFEKGYQPKFTEETFRIKKVLVNLPQPRYIVESYDSKETIKGTFYEREITKATHQEYKIEKVLKTRKRGRLVEHFVKWLGYSDAHNSWVKDSDMKNF